MDELELLIAIVVGIFKLIRWIFRTLFRGVFGLFGAFKRAQSGQMDANKAAPLRLVPKKTAPSQIPASARPIAISPAASPALKQAIDRLKALSEEADAESERCAKEEANLPFVDGLRWVTDEAKRLSRGSARDGKAMGELFAAAEKLESLFEVLQLLASQRRNRDLLELLGDADALAESCYRPIVDHCRQRGIKLVSDRTATIMGGDKLFILSVDDPSGLAPIVLPSQWATQIGWWPALSHEIGHDFFNSVTGLDAEMRRTLRLPGPRGVLPGPSVRDNDIDAAVGSWMEELFADAFGTMMLGPAFVATMHWSFASPSEPVTAQAAMPTKDGRFEEHPPGHVRVVVACRLLGKMGYGAIGDRMEANWRRAHKEPRFVYLPTRAGKWATLPESVILDRAAEVGESLYQTGLLCLSGFPLRSVVGLDFGPREHEAAISVRDGILAGRTPRVKDPRLVIAGAVLAWTQKPADAARVLKVARDLIDAVGVSRRKPAWASDAVESESAVAVDDANLWRDAIVLDTLLAPRRTGRPIKSPR